MKINTTEFNSRPLRYCIDKDKMILINFNDFVEAVGVSISSNSIPVSQQYKREIDGETYTSFYGIEFVIYYHQTEEALAFWKWSTSEFIQQVITR